MKRPSIASWLLAVGLIALLAVGTSTAATDKREPVRPFGVAGLLTLPTLGSYKTYIESCTAGSADDLLFNYRTSKRVGKQRKAGWALYRAKANGKPNRRFGRAGVVRRIPGLEGSPVQVAVDRNGGVLVAFVTKRESAGGSKVLLLRLDSQGKLDRTFGLNGITDTTLPGTRIVRQLRQISDGSIVLVQTGFGGYPPEFGTVALFDQNGSPDTSFGDRGKWSGQQFFPYSVDFRDGSFYIGGDSTDTAANSVSSQATVYKLDRTGVPDPSWGSQGKFVYGSGIDGDPTSQLHVHANADGSLVVSVEVETSGDQEEWTAYSTIAVDPRGVLVPQSYKEVYETYGLLNEADPQPEYFNAEPTMGADGRFVVAGFGDGKERYSIQGASLAPGGKVRKFKRRPPKSFDIANGIVSVVGPRELLACGERYRGRSSFAAAFKMTLP